MTEPQDDDPQDVAPPPTGVTRAEAEAAAARLQAEV